ncbi:MAG TPA: hypothetical protein VGI42_02445, partial [Chthoniobacterales bacterium]
MKSAIFPVIRQGLIPRIDDGAVELDPLINVVHDVIRALADLKINVDLGLRELEIERERIRLT